MKKAILRIISNKISLIQNLSAVSSLFYFSYNCLFCILFEMEMHLFKKQFMHFLFIQNKPIYQIETKGKMNVDMI